jgi:hypothetical protein
MTRRDYYVVAAAVFTLWLGISTAAWIALGR